MQITPSLAMAAAVDAGNAHARKHGRKPSNLGPWPAEEWTHEDWDAYAVVLVRLYKLMDEGIAGCIARQYGVAG